MSALAVLPADRCPACGHPVTETAYAEPALFVHGGYGATRATRLRTCGHCDWALVVEVTETAPLAG